MFGSRPPGAPTMLAQHHRKSSGLNMPPTSSTEEDDDAWADDSDEERSRNQSSISASPAPPPDASAKAAAAPASSSWFSSPFALLSGAVGGGASGNPKAHAQSASTSFNGPEMLAAVLGGGGAPAPEPAVATNKLKKKASTSLSPSAQPTSQPKKDKKEPVKLTSEPVIKRAATPVMERVSSGGLLAECQRAVKTDVGDIVRDPVALLSRLTLQGPASPTLAEPLPRLAAPDDTPVQQQAPFTSADMPPPLSPPTNKKSKGKGKEGEAVDGDDSSEDDDPAAGYVRLDATSFSSLSPGIAAPDAHEEEEAGDRLREKRRRKTFLDCLSEENVDVGTLRKLAWGGIPADLRPMSWQILLGYLPSPSSRRAQTLARKRQEYHDAVASAFSRGKSGLEGPIWHQISIDVPRTNAGVRLWQCETTQRALERVLYVWAIRHPASGYVQGINDLVTPFFQVFLSSYIDAEPETYDTAALPKSVMDALEADSFWCLSKLLDGIQSNYTFAQPGIQAQIKRMKELCARVDAPLSQHLQEQGVDFIQFAFRWMNCLLMRELSVRNIVRMWDTYLAEGTDAFSEFHLYVSLTFLVKWSEQLQTMDFQGIIMFLQSLPTQDWTDKNTELLLSEAFMWKSLFHNAQSHLKP